MNRGILGASNSTGQWQIQIKGDDLDLESKSRKNRERYGEAAYFIQQQIAQLPTKANQKEEEEEEKKLTKYGNFKDNFGDYISKTY